jgi:hypothetical protein
MDDVEHIGTVLGSPREGAAEDFFRAIRESGALPRGLDVDEAASAVLCTLLGRLDLEQAREVLDCLPPTICERIGRCPIHGGSVAEPFDASEFLRRIAGHLQITQDVARPIASAVLQALRGQLPPHPAGVVDRELPRDLQKLWRGEART